MEKTKTNSKKPYKLYKKLCQVMSEKDAMHCSKLSFKNSTPVCEKCNHEMNYSFSPTIGYYCDNCSNLDIVTIAIDNNDKVIINKGDKRQLGITTSVFKYFLTSSKENLLIVTYNHGMAMDILNSIKLFLHSRDCHFLTDTSTRITIDNKIIVQVASCININEPILSQLGNKFNVIINEPFFQPNIEDCLSIIEERTSGKIVLEGNVIKEIFNKKRYFSKLIKSKNNFYKITL